MKLKKMTREEACHELADFNEAIYEYEESLADIRSRLVWDADDEKRKKWYLKREKEVAKKLEKMQKEHDKFLEKYYDVIHPEG